MGIFYNPPKNLNDDVLEYDEYPEKMDENVLLESNITEDSIVDQCGISLAHMIKYKMQPDLQSGNWITSSLYGYLAYKNAAPAIQANFRENYNIARIYNKAHEVLLNSVNIDYSYSLYDRLYANQPAGDMRLTKEELVRLDKIREFLENNKSSEKTKNWVRDNLPNDPIVKFKPYDRHNIFNNKVSEYG